MSPQSEVTSTRLSIRPHRWQIALGKIPAIIMLVAVLATATVFHLSWRTVFHQSIFELAHRLGNRITSEIAYEISLLLGGASSEVKLLHKLLAEDVVNLNDSVARETFFLSVLQSNPTFSWVTFGFPNGNFFGAQQQAPDRFRAVDRVWNPDTKVARSVDRLFQRDGEMLQLSNTIVSEQKYFAPERAWYRDAVRAGRRVWTDVYIYASSQKPGIDVAMPLEKQGQLVGVIAIGIELDQISKYLSTIEVGKTGISFIINRRAELIAYGDAGEVVVTDNVGEKLRLGRLANAKAPLLRVAAKALERWDLAGVQSVSNHVAQVDDDDYLVTLAPSIHNDWLIGTVIPSREFVSEVDSIQNRLLLVVSCAVILLSALVLAWIRAFLVRPLTVTTDLISQIGQGGAWQEEIVATSPIVEINRLVQAMRQMGLDLHALRNNEHEQVQMRLNQERSFVQLNRAMREAEDVDALCRVGLHFLIRALDAQVGSIYLLEEDGLLRLYSSHAVTQPYLPERMDYREGWLAAVFEERTMKVLTDIPADCFVMRTGVMDLLPSTLVALPLLLNDQVHGVITLGRVQPFSAPYLDFALRVAGAIAVAIAGVQSILRNRILLNQTLQQKEALIQSQSELNTTIEQLQRTSEYKSQFLANMSHEIRTPINAVIGMSYLTLRTQLSDTQHDYVSKIHYSARALLGIINDILDFSKIEAGEMAMESVPFNLDDTMENLANLICVKAEEKGLFLLFSRSKDVPTLLLGDPLRLGQILTNLTANAIKFTEAGNIVISIRCLRQWEGKVDLQFQVEDTGIGLNEVQVGRLFSPFSQADASTTRKYGGTGLGLSICKHLVEMMGGSIGVNSELGRGSQFHFNAWFALQSDAEQHAMALDEELLGLKVLVVDDHLRFQEICQDMLVDYGCHPRQATTAEQALQMLEEAVMDPAQEPFRLVILTWKMLHLNGLQLAQRIRQSTLFGKDLRIILVTPYNRQEVIPASERHLLNAFLPKPVNPSQLLAAIQVAFNLKKREGRKNRKLDPVQNTDAAQRIMGARVLLADDNKINQQVSTALLEGHGLQVTVVGNGREAVEAVKQNAFEIALMDIQMPEMDGFQATRMIRTLPGGEKLPIIALTAHAMVGDREKSLTAGMNDHITKPIDPEKLFQTLVQWITPKDRQALAVKKTVALDTQPQPGQESLPGIDMAVGLRQVAGNRVLLYRLLREFRQDYQHVVRTIREGLQQDKRPEVLRVIHTVKGIAGSLGAHALHRYTRDLESTLKGGDGVEYAPLLEQFSQEIGRVFHGIAALPAEAVAGSSPQAAVPGPAEGAAAVVDQAHVRALLRELRQLLAAGHSRSAEKLAEIRAHCPNESYLAVGQQLEQLIEEFEFEAAVQAVDVLAQGCGITQGEEGT
ncbi:MAG: response regulator [Magnetococcales bacterium]|nr:response regulator [Magnetococcales bacterium]MBF0113658.1 response regulator [Magnetococcales bacterium]